MGRHPIGDTAMTSAERMRRMRLRRDPPKPLRADGMDDGRAEALTARVAELEAALRSRDARVEGLTADVRSRDAEIAKLRATVTGEQPQALDWKDDKRTRALRTEIKNLKAKVVHVTEREERDWVKAGGIPRKTFTSLVKCTHPDKYPPSLEDCVEGYRGLTEWNQAKRFRADA